LNRRKIAALASSLAATVALFLIPAAPAYASTALIANLASGQMGCLQQNSFASSEQTTTAFCDGNSFQAWAFDFVGFDNDRQLFHIRNLATGLCLRASSNADFAPVQQIGCSSASNDSWFFRQSGVAGGIVIKSDISTGGTPCMDLFQGPSTSVSKPIDVFHCTHDDSTNTNPAQIFHDTQLT
jgi:hypothetical protein